MKDISVPIVNWTFDDGKANANELRDQRETLIDQLSAIVSVKVIETPVYDTYNPDRLTGANRYLVQIAGGQTLVDTNEYNALDCVARKKEEKVNMLRRVAIAVLHSTRDPNINYV